VLGKVQATYHQLEDGQTGWTTLTTISNEHAIKCASKLLTDFLSFGDMEQVSGSPTLLKLKDTGWWRIGVQGDQVFVAYAPTTESLTKLVKSLKADKWEPALTDAYPRWFDRFDKDAVGMGMLGWGILPQDFYGDYDWTVDRFSRVLGSSQSETRYVAPGVFDFSLTDWWKTMADEHDVAYDFYLSEMYPERPKFSWNISPLPYNSPLDGSLVYQSFYRQRLANYSGFTPIDSVDPYLSAAQFGVAQAYANDDSFGSFFALPELGGNALLQLSGIAGSKATKTAWHNFLQNEQGFSLKDVGRLYRGDEAAFSNWDQLEVPTMKTFAGWSNATSLDLSGDGWRGKADVERRGVEEEWFRSENQDEAWTEMASNDARIMSYDGLTAGGKRNAGAYFWLSQTFEVDATNEAILDYLHISMTGWHRTESDIDAWLNGAPLNKITQYHPLTGDLDECFELGDHLQAGKNTLVLNTNGRPIPGYIFLSSTGRWEYPSDNQQLNRLYFDAVEFAAWQRMQWVENTLKAYRAGDTQGHPLLVMSPMKYLDLLMPLFRKYGAYAHCTGQSGVVWAPWVTSYAIPHGVPISSEPGSAPRDVLGMRRMTTLYALQGNDAINYLFNPTQYRDGDDGAIGEWIDHNLDLINTVGKMDPPASQIGVLRSVRDASRLSFKQVWSSDVSRGTLQSIGRRGQLVDPIDLKPDGLAGQYPVLMDAGTELFTDEEISNLERYVKNGGVFIALHNTGLHSPEQAHAWPIERLTGLKVVNQNRGTGGMIRFTENQTLWPSLQGKEIEGWGLVYDWRNEDVTGDALQMEALNEDIEIIAEWVDRKDGQGKIAIATRKLGKGRVVTLGSTFWNKSSDKGGRYTITEGAKPYLSELLDQLGVERTSTVDSEQAAREVFAEAWRSKNGLYDLYLVARINDKVTDTMALTASFPTSTTPSNLVEISADQHPTASFTSEESGGFSIDVDPLEPMQMRVFAAPRPDLAKAPLHWLKSQERRWHALEPVPASEKPEIHKTSPWILPLVESWHLLPAPQPWNDQPETTTDWSQAKEVRLGSFDALGLAPDSLAHFRRVVQLPEEWMGRRVSLVFDSPKAWFWGVTPNGKLWINGERSMNLKWQRDYSHAIDVIVPENGRLVFELEVDGSLPEGTKRSRPTGVFGIFYLQADAVPTHQMDLQWKKVTELGLPTKPATLDEHAEFLMLESRFTLPNDWPQDKLFIETSESLGWLLINNQVVQAPSHMRALDVSGLLRKDGGENLINWAPSTPPSYKKRFNATPPKMQLVALPDRTLSSIE
jgi:hypothetical protein